VCHALVWSAPACLVLRCSAALCLFLPVSQHNFSACVHAHASSWSHLRVRMPPAALHRNPSKSVLSRPSIIYIGRAHQSCAMSRARRALVLATLLGMLLLVLNVQYRNALPLSAVSSTAAVVAAPGPLDGAPATRSELVGSAATAPRAPPQAALPPAPPAVALLSSAPPMRAPYPLGQILTHPLSPQGALMCAELLHERVASPCPSSQMQAPSIGADPCTDSRVAWLRDRYGPCVFALHASVRLRGRGLLTTRVLNAVSVTTSSRIGT